MPPFKLNMSSLPECLTICKLNRDSAIPAWATEGEFYALTRTAEELSIVCAQAAVPDGIEMEPNWRALKVEGPLDFALTGILASLATTLAAAGISLFALSTFDTDYILVKADRLAQAIEALEQAGHIIS